MIKKIVSKFLILSMVVVCLSGCSKKNNAQKEPVVKEKPTKNANVEDKTIKDSDVKEKIIESTKIKEKPTKKVDIKTNNSKEVERENNYEKYNSIKSENDEERLNYKFNSHAVSPLTRKIYGDKIINTWLKFMDSVTKGEEKFECPDEYTYNELGLLPGLCFPVAQKDIEFDRFDDRGIGYITYNIPKDEYLKKQEEFIKLTENILNKTLSKNDTDIEKCLKLYLYMTKNTKYDDNIDEVDALDIGSYRALVDHKGICIEIARAYSYLLAQAGVDASVLGTDKRDTICHSWSYVNINGKFYQIDPTWGLYEDGEKPTLEYFMMNDDIREKRDGINMKLDCIEVSGPYFVETNQKYSDYVCKDESFKTLWDKKFVELDTNKKVIKYVDENGKKGDFSYENLEK